MRGTTLAGRIVTHETIRVIRAAAQGVLSNRVDEDDGEVRILNVGV